MKKIRCDGWCLTNIRSGKLYPHTFAVDKDEAWMFSFEHLYANYKWMGPFWKKWEESIKEAEKHGYELWPVNIKHI